MMVMGNIESIQVAYDRTKSYIVYDSFQYIMIAIVVFLIGMKLWDEWQKNLSNNNHRFDVAAYWGQVKICLVVCFIATSAGMVFIWLRRSALSCKTTSSTIWVVIRATNP